MPELVNWRDGKFSGEPYVIDINVDQIQVHKVFPSYLIVSLDQADHSDSEPDHSNFISSASMTVKGQQFCSVLKRLEITLACEYLDKKRVFGTKATVSEMASFKSKVKKQDPVYDP